MSSCKFPQHHRSSQAPATKSRVVAVVALVLAVMWIRVHLADLARWAVIVGLVLVAAAAVVLVARFVRHLAATSRRPSGVICRIGMSHRGSVMCPALRGPRSAGIT